jgi:hypothetical protein
MQEHLESPGAAPPPRERFAVSSAAILDRWREYNWLDAVSLDELSPFDRVVITTRNHAYEIVVASPEDGTVLVRGGTAFTEFAEARLVGSCFGGSTAKLRTVAVGFRIEFAVEGRCLLTTRVETLAVVPAGASRREPLAS